MWGLSFYPEGMSQPETSFANLRVGQGIDVHAFAADGAVGVLHLAGLDWPGEPVLEGHSDGDVAAHAICDALLSASGLGDLGAIFGTSDPRWAGASGATLLAETKRLLDEAGCHIINVTVQVVGARPRLSPRLGEATAALADALDGAPVSLSATTTDGLGFLGRVEGLAAISTALIYRG